MKALAANPEHLHCDSPPRLPKAPNRIYICQWSFWDHQVCCNIRPSSQSSFYSSLDLAQCPLFVSLQLKRSRLSGHSINFLDSHTPLRNMPPLKSRGPLGAVPPSWLQAGADYCFKPVTSHVQYYWTQNISLSDKNSFSHSYSLTSDSKSASSLE